MSIGQRPLPPSRHGPGWPLLAVLVLGVLAVLAAWFAVTGPLTGSDKGGRQRYVEAVVGEPTRISPLFAYLNDADRDLTSLVFSGLTRLGQRGEVLPDLAESWDIGDDSKSVTFHLRAGVVWHTGVAFTSADVIFTYSLLADPNVRSDPDQAPLWRQVKCAAPDDLTVTCQLPEPFSPFMAYTTVGIVPKHLLEGADAASLFENPFNRAPVGTGPYRLLQFDPSSVVLQANDKYYLGAPGIPQVELRFYQDPAGATAGMVRGDVDGLLLDSTASQSDYDTLTSLSRVRGYNANRSAYTILYLNNGTPPLNEKPVRQAIAETIDIDAVIGDILGGRAARADSPIIPGTWAFNPDVKSYKHDKADAGDLLDEAGWTLPEGKDVRERNGAEFRLSLMTDQDPARGAIAEEVTRQLAEAGIAATVVREDSASLVRDFLVPRQYQAAIFGWDPGPDPDPYSAWHSSQATGNGRNLATFTNDQADHIMEEARLTWDLDQRQRLYFTFQNVVHDEVPSILLFYPVYTYFVSSDVKGVELGTLFGASSRFRNVHEWSFDDVPDIRGQ